MGTPEFAVPALMRLVEDGHEIAAVYTKPDMPKNRGMKLTISPVKEYSLTQNISVLQPQSFSISSEFESVKELAPELIVVVAYGKLLPQAILDIPKYGCVNIHASILPKYRGAAPIQRAVLSGETVTGVTAMRIAAELDAGDIIDTVKTQIYPFETSEQLSKRLSELGAELISQTVQKIENGTAVYTAQEHDKATYAKMLSRELSPIDWTKPRNEIINQVRGLMPWPVATSVINDVNYKVYEVRPADYSTELPPGTVVATGDKGIDISCLGGEVLTITVLQAAGSKRMPAVDYLRGHKI